MEQKFTIIFSVVTFLVVVSAIIVGVYYGTKSEDSIPPAPR
jgi:hypothetical protein